MVVVLSVSIVSIRHDLIIGGTDNVALALSRFPVDSSVVDEYKRTEEFAYSKVKEAMLVALVRRGVEAASVQNPTLELVAWLRLQMVGVSCQKRPINTVKG